MSLINFFRCKIRKILTKENDIMLTNKIPSYDILYRKFADINEFGIYLHIPFCRQICPYCPYNKEIYKPGLANLYAKAVKNEIDIYAELFRGRPVTSFYIGGGTPTTMLDSGLYEILDYIYKKFIGVCT
jgi:oxygen-independent coproporphyrinogen-3 oxidase